MIQTTNSSTTTDILSRLATTFSNIFPSAIRALPTVKYTYTGDIFPGFAVNVRYVDPANNNTIVPTLAQIQTVVNTILTIPGIVMVEEVNNE